MSQAPFWQYPVLVPSNLRLPSFGYLSRSQFCQQLAHSAQIGRYDLGRNLHLDPGLMARYGSEIPRIAEALACSPRDERYRRVKVATIDKATHEVHLEWLLAQRLGRSRISFTQFELLRRALGVQPLLVDMMGPAVEVIWPDSLEAALVALNQLEQRVNLTPAADLSSLPPPADSQWSRASGF
ncbi:hypothetical protein [Aestuariirhabdus litorea]|uniref:Uncharacterized protein n=1 Tax=Aestuariirhabdus litorea TaxID=2528527 RepID=A0A3P3VRZ7_9GAMM|nr:hypothetical protein [Aestuariirhabdus litorea]RRJ83573.1 hypothetical protein D0544_00145 [Aestuariirhabdus litorea]RWW96794.1 hypothetical protein DZC74_00145 [Endozoicomonadaceae bacterium GTF-13]